jgi:hypothetical protein
MKSTFPFLLMVIFLGCNSSSAEKVAGTNISSPAKNESPANDAAASASIKIFKNDKLVIEYKTSFPQAGITTFKSGEKEAALKLSNDDNTYNLIATLEKPASGNYPIGKGGLGQVSLQLTTDGKGAVPFMTDLTEGTFKITFSGETCSGNFTGIQKEDGMPNIRITGDFTSIPVIKNTVNY